jgi:single-strand DNA-binding protein
MASYNRIIMMGNLTRDPQLSYLPSKTPVVDFGLASNRKFKRADGTDGEETCFVDCRCFGRMAETINKYCQKGKSLLVEGRLTYDTWEAQDGSKRSKHRIMVENFTFVGGPGGQDASRQRPAEGAEWNGPANAGEPAPPPEDDIPF